ncbi:L-threonylcarbamoyladenylate synthase [Granulicella cerasi]|uniref:Threonylcarbamoyl-AMP synthase n=1 Tax=Granulicella cerasi TaxID=741063 RepID=A0ABW1Z6C6_9BACT|nr:L-threonylcarbamoyladenylate synthase [Granulicella cerasi]
MSLTTLQLNAENPADLLRAAELLRRGKLVAFPTETVYGLGANALDAEAVAAIFEAKQRPSWDPLIVHLGTIGQLKQVAEVPQELKGRVARLLLRFWPGPLTLLLPKKASIPDAVTAGRPLVGVRVPALNHIRYLIEHAGVPIAAPSANRFGHTSPTIAAHVLADLDGRIDALLDGGATSVGVESTVLDPTQTPMVLYRPGAITAAEIEAVAGVPVVVYEPPATVAAPESLPSPGVGIRHYAPNAKVILVEDGEATKHLRGTSGVMLPTGWTAEAQATVFPWGDWDKPEELAQKLFAGLRGLDDLGVTEIVVPLPAPGGVRDALRDRLLKAAKEK